MDHPKPREHPVIKTFFTVFYIFIVCKYDEKWIRSESNRQVGNTVIMRPIFMKTTEWRWAFQ